MPCPTCGSDEVVPLVLRRFDGLAGAVRLCAECRDVLLIASEARLPDALADVQVRGWKAVRALLAGIPGTGHSISSRAPCASPA